jgi:TonB family protein
LKELPVVDKLNREFKDKGLVVLTINTSEGPETIREFLKGTAYTFPVLLDEEGKAANSFQIFGIPQSFVIDRQNNIIAHLSGYSAKTEGEMRAAIGKALFGSEQAANPPVVTQSGATDNANDPESMTKVIRASSAMLEQFAAKKVQPPYPPKAKESGVQGAVKIEVTVSETGEVIAAKPVSGPEELREVCLIAAKMWKFNPIEFSGSPVKAQGVLTFHFTLK